MVLPEPQDLAAKAIAGEAGYLFQYQRSDRRNVCRVGLPRSGTSLFRGNGTPPAIIFIDEMDAGRTGRRVRRCHDERDRP